MSITVARDDLDRAMEMLMVCAVKARDNNGLRVMWRIDPSKLETAVLHTLQSLCPYDGEVIPSAPMRTVDTPLYGVSP